VKNAEELLATTVLRLREQFANQGIEQLRRQMLPELGVEELLRIKAKQDELRALKLLPL
jgi:hypothetical protein